jgi:hypothetical protein
MPVTMKNDPYFKYLALVIIAGVLLAIIEPAPAPADESAHPPVAVAAAGH